MRGYYLIWASGAITLEYREANASEQRKESASCALLPEPFRKICAVATALSAVTAALDERDLSNSQKFVILEDLKSSGVCPKLNAQINRELSRLSALPLLKEAAFGKVLSNLNETHCPYEVSKRDLPTEERPRKYVRLVARGEQRAFAIINLDDSDQVVSFEPLVPLQEVADLPPDDPCFTLADKVADLPAASPEGRRLLKRKWARLRKFDRLSHTAPFVDPPFASDKTLMVPQGAGRSSSEPLYTQGMMPCVGVAVLNRKTKKAFLIHADARTDVESLINRLSSEVGAGPLEGVVAGGDPSAPSRDTLFRILEALDSKNVRILGYRPNPGIDSLAVDPRSGTFF